MAVNVELNLVNMRRSSRCINTGKFTIYNTHDNLIMIKTIDEEWDTWYTFISVIHRPEFKTVFLVSMFECDFIAHRHRHEGTIDENLMEHVTEQMIRKIMKLSDDYVVTDSKEVYNTRRENYIRELQQQMRENPIIVHDLYSHSMVQAVKDVLPQSDIAEKVLSAHMMPDIAWYTDDLSKLDSLKAEYFLDFNDNIPHGANRMHYAEPNAYVRYLEDCFYGQEWDMDGNNLDTTYIELRINTN